MAVTHFRGADAGCEAEAREPIGFAIDSGAREMAVAAISAATENAAPNP
jgi:hypothetical protein